MLNKLFISCFYLLLTLNVQAKLIDHIELKDANIRDAARILASLTDTNITVTQAASDTQVNLLLQNVELEHGIETLSRITGLWYRYNSDNNSYLIMTKDEYQSDIIVYRKDNIRSFTLKHQNVRATAQTIKDLFGDRVILKEQNDQDDFDGLPSAFRDDGKNITSDAKDTDNDTNDNSSSRDNSSQTTSNNEVEISSVDQGIDRDIQAAKLRKITTNVQTPKLNIDKTLGIRTPIHIATNRIHNLLYVRTSDQEAMSEIAKLIRTSDKPTPQVLLETKIIAIDDSNARDLQAGFEFDGITIGRKRDVTAGIYSSFYDAFSDSIKFKIKALEKNNQATTISKPILLASNNRPARIFIGKKQVIATSITGDVTTTIADNVREITDNRTLETEKVDIGNTLAIQPSINADGSVTLDIQQTSSRIIEDGLQFPTWNKETGEITIQDLPSYEESSIRTVAIAKDGTTIALGGNIVESNQKGIKKVPGLGSLPILGKLFSSESKTRTKTHYIMLITPHIINSPHQGSDVSNRIPDIKELSSTAVSSKQEKYIYLNRYAANAIRNRRSNDNSVIAQSISDNDQPLFTSTHLSTKLLASYQQEQLYVSVLEVKNNSNETQPINLQNLKGKWLSAAREQPVLPAKGQKLKGYSDTSYIYLVSAQSFEKSINY